MKKGIEWLKKEIATEMIQLEPNRKERWSDIRYQTLRDVAQKIDQINEPEVLSQKWIDEHATAVTYDEILDRTETTYVVDLENLIIPKEESEVTLNRAFEKIAEAYPMTKEEVCRHLEKFVAHGGKVTYGEQEVLSQELPVVPTWFDEWWKDMTKGEGNLFHNIGRFQEELFDFETREAYNYITDTGNKKKLLDIIVNELEYEVEEPLYYALIKGHELITDKGDWTFKYWKTDTSDGRVFPSHRLKNHDDYLTEMSKEDWNKLGINDSNADFVEVEER